VFYMTYWITYYDLYGRDPEPLGSTHLFGAPYGLFKTSDGYLYISIVSDEHWRRFCTALGFQDLLGDPRYRSNRDRVLRKAELEGEVAKRLSKMPTEEVFKALAGAGVPVAPLYTVSRLLGDQHLAYRGLVGEVEWGGRAVRLALNPLRIDGSRPSARGSPPSLGSSTREVLKGLLGLSDQEVEELASRGVIG